MNVKLEDLGGEISQGIEGFIFLRYVFVDDKTLHIFQLDPEPITSGIQAKKLKGTMTYDGAPEKTNNGDVSRGKQIGCAVITDSSANIVGFIESREPGELFSDVMKFERIK